MCLCLYLRLPPVVLQGRSVPFCVHLHLLVIGDLDVVLAVFIPSDTFKFGLGDMLPVGCRIGCMSNFFCPRVNFFVLFRLLL